MIYCLNADHYAGPMAQNIKNEANLTSSEFQNLADARKPGAPAATGQPLTRKRSSR